MKARLPASAILLASPLLLGNEDPAEANSPPELDRSPAWTEQALPGSLRNCQDTIHQVRQERGLAEIQRETADPDAPILFHALDYDIDGCDVLLARDGEVRDLPLIPEGPLRVQPAQ